MAELPKTPFIVFAAETEETKGDDQSGGFDKQNQFLNALRELGMQDDHTTRLHGNMWLLPASSSAPHLAILVRVATQNKVPYMTFLVNDIVSLGGREKYANKA